MLFRSTLNSGGGVSSLPMQTLTLDSGGILAQSGNSGYAGPSVGVATGLVATTFGREVMVFTPGGSSLTFGGVITAGSTTGLTKAGAGTLELTRLNPFTGQTTVNEGTLKLSGGLNTLSAGGAALVVNSGGTLDLNGNVQLVGNLSSQGAGVNASVAGGTVTSSGAGGLLVSNANNVSFSGSLSGGNLAFARAGANTLNLLGANSYGGATLLNGGTTVLSEIGRAHV